MKAFDYRLVVLRVAFNHPRHRIGEPFLKLPMGLENVRHQEMHQRPQFHQVVLQGRSRQQEASVMEKQAKISAFGSNGTLNIHSLR